MKKRSLLVLGLISTALMAETCPAPKVESSPGNTEVSAQKSGIVSRQEISKVESLNSYEADRTGDNTCTLSKSNTIHFQVVGQGVAPLNTVSPAQAMALAKRAAIADAYRQLGEKICGVRVEGRDLIRNMMISRSTVRTEIDALIKNARILDTKFKDGLCEVEMEVTLNGKEWYARLSR
ncbi:putative lipoprotein required for motility [Hydrogenimonas sp.]|nr:putative lipoprotein required for motility [Hydrogenimonas sp.]